MTVKCINSGEDLFMKNDTYLLNILDLLTVTPKFNVENLRKIYFVLHVG